MGYGSILNFIWLYSVSILYWVILSICQVKWNLHLDSFSLIQCYIYLFGFPCLCIVFNQDSLVEMQWMVFVNPKRFCTWARRKGMGGEGKGKTDVWLLLQLPGYTCIENPKVVSYAAVSCTFCCTLCHVWLLRLFRQNQNTSPNRTGESWPANQGGWEPLHQTEQGSHDLLTRAAESIQALFFACFFDHYHNFPYGRPDKTINSTARLI